MSDLRFAMEDGTARFETPMANWAVSEKAMTSLPAGWEIEIRQERDEARHLTIFSAVLTYPVSMTDVLAAAAEAVPEPDCS
jgi:hypothetical protein